LHIAFRAPSRDAVDRFHATGRRCGATTNGDPGVRRGRYDCAFLIDLDGNNLEAGVCA
jgi:predicted lactoylglutathione lyase